MAKGSLGRRLLSLLRDFFIPHQGNRFKPYSLRTKATVAILIFIVLAEVILLTQVALRSGSRDFLALVLPDALTSLTNGQRVSRSLPALTIDQALSNAAQAHAEEMARKGYFAHVSPEGNLPWVWFDQYGYSYKFAGENLAVNFVDSTDVVAAWMNSPTHRENIMRAEFTEIGIGVATGTYEGRTTMFVVQFFGTKKALAVAPASAPTPTLASAPQLTPQPAPAPAPAEASPTGEVSAEEPAPEVLTAQAPAPAPAALGESTGTSFWSNVKQILRTAPRVLSNYIFLTLLALLTISFLLAFLIKLRIQYVRILTHGLALIALVSGMLLANNAILGGDVKVPDRNLNAAVIFVIE